MSSPAIPAAPAAPDYAAANREGIYTDIETLPLRRGIDQAAQLGQTYTYTDPQTGEQRTADFTGLGNMALAQQAAVLAGQTNADVQRQQLALRQELGVGNAQQTAAEVRAADPLAYDTRQDLTGRLRADLNSPAPQYQDDAAVARLADLYDRATRLDTNVNDPSNSALNLGLQRAVQDFQLGGKLDPNVQRELTDAARAGQAARGNYLGDAAAVVESQNLGSAMEQRQAQRLAALQGLQQQAFGQNSSLRQEQQARQMAQLGTLQGLQQQAFGQNQATDATNYGRGQQNLANVSAMVLGQPITNQFGSLGAAQQGAVGYNPTLGQSNANMNANAGAQAAQFAQGNFGTSSQNWGTQANIAAQGSPWMALLGQAVGGAAGGATAALI